MSEYFQRLQCIGCGEASLEGDGISRSAQITWPQLCPVYRMKRSPAEICEEQEAESTTGPIPVQNLFRQARLVIKPPMPQILSFGILLKMIGLSKRLDFGMKPRFGK